MQNIMDNKLVIYKLSLGININKRSIKVNTEIVIDKELDKANLSLNCILSTILSFFITKAGIFKSLKLLKIVYEWLSKNIVLTINR